MTALPTLEQVRTRRLLPIDDATAFSLYTSCVLPAQNAANGPGNEMELMYSRVIGYLFLYAPSDTARGELKMAMASCKNNSNPFGFLYRLGEYYLKNLIIICKSHSVFFIMTSTVPDAIAVRKNRGRIPAPSEHTSRPSFDRLKETIMKNLRPSPRNHSEAKASVNIRQYLQIVELVAHVLSRPSPEITFVAWCLAASMPFPFGAASPSFIGHMRMRRRRSAATSSLTPLATSTRAEVGTRYVTGLILVYMEIPVLNDMHIGESRGDSVEYLASIRL